jgi:hypothetical protein
MGIVYVLAAFFTNRWRYWIAAASLLASALWENMPCISLFRYFFVYLLINDRRQLSNSRLYVSLLLGILLFSPVIIWNIEHQFIGYMHIQNLSGLGDTYHWKLTNINNFLFGQVALMSPFLS